MTIIYQILAILGAAFIIWWLHRSIKANPEAFSKDNFSKSFTTMGLLAIGLILFVFILIQLVKS